MRDPEQQSDNDELEPLYNPATTDQSPVDDWILELPFPADDIEPLYNPATMEFAEPDEED